MEKILSYQPGTTICIAPLTVQRVAVQSSRGAQPLDISIGRTADERYARLMGRWIVDCSSNLVFLRENNSRERDDCLVISFQEPDITVSVTYQSSESGRSDTQRIEHVARIDVYPREVGKIRITANVQETACTDPNPDANQAGNETVRALQEKLQEERERNSRLQEIVEARLEEVLQAALQRKADLAGENAGRLHEAEAAESEADRLEAEGAVLADKVEEARNRRDAAKTRLEQLERKLTDLGELAEATELDCDGAKRQLEEIKVRVKMDADTLALLEDGTRLKHGTISGTIAGLEKEIERVERRIALILKLRKKFIQAVENSIFQGDGTITAGEESGGDADGSTSTAAPEDPGAEVGD